MSTVSSVPTPAARLAELSAGLERPTVISVGLPRAFAQRLVGEGLDALRARSLVSWESPRRGQALFGFGVAAAEAGPREEPVSAAAPVLRLLSADARSEGVSPAARPRWFGGARFTPGGPVRDRAWDVFGGWQFVLPKVLLAIAGDRVEASLTMLVDPGVGLPRNGSLALDVLAAEFLGSETAASTPSPALEGFREATRREWEGVVAEALQELRDSGLEKVVLARSQRLDVASPPDPGRILARLSARYPQCFVFSFKRGGCTWLGASPELLCRVGDGSVEAESLAGSRPRGACRECDERLAAELFASGKERQEHALVVQAIAESLAAVCSSISVPGEPQIMRMANIQHLFTPLSGRLANGVGVLDIVARLHPTPAVAGWPRVGALRTIERLEAMDRGWYAGPIGWVDLAGEGEFAVALRSALVLGSEVRLYAGGGIVPGSEPRQEYAETETKLQPIREALGSG